MRALVFSVVACCVSCATYRPPSPPKQPLFDEQIVFGHRIGPVALTMSAADLLRALGPPQGSLGGGAVLQYSAKGLGVRLEHERVCQVSTADRRYRTSRNVGVGSSDLELRVAHGPAPRVRVDRAQNGDVLGYVWRYADTTQVHIVGPDLPATIGRPGSIQLIFIGDCE
jgi:hypothetical protein